MKSPNHNRYYLSINIKIIFSLAIWRLIFEAYFRASTKKTKTSSLLLMSWNLEVGNNIFLSQRFTSYLIFMILKIYCMFQCHVP